MKTLHIAVIGKTGHAGRLINLLRQKAGVVLHSVYYHRDAVDDILPITSRFEDVLSADAVVLASPTYTHAQYLDRLADYGGYLLIEKPAVSTEQESAALKGWPVSRKMRSKINYNFWFSRLAEKLSAATLSPAIGSAVSLDVHTSHGLAFTEGYRPSWRNSRRLSFGVLEMVGVHFIHLAMSLFGGIETIATDCYWHASCREGVPDTVFVRLGMEGGVYVHLTHSYAAPYCNRMMLAGTNGYWEYDGREARLYSPRDTFDAGGRFTFPPLADTAPLVFAEVWSESLDRSLEQFLSTVRSGGGFSPEDFDRGLAAMQPVFQARRRYDANG